MPRTRVFVVCGGLLGGLARLRLHQLTALDLSERFDTAWSLLVIMPEET